MDFEDFKNLAAGVQSCFVALAVLVGGTWALCRFFLLKDIERARAEVEKSRKELSERGHLQVKLTVTPGATMVNRQGVKHAKTAKVRLKTENLKTEEYQFRVSFSVPAKEK